MQSGVIANILVYKLHNWLTEGSLKKILLSPSINMKTDLDLSLKSKDSFNLPSLEGNSFNSSLPGCSSWGSLGSSDSGFSVILEFWTKTIIVEWNLPDFSQEH